MTLDQVFSNFAAGDNIGRAAWLKPPKVTESYIFLETSTGGASGVVRFITGNSGTTVGEYHASMEDIIADDWSVVP